MFWSDEFERGALGRLCRLENIPDAEVVEEYQNIYGESSSYEMIQGEVKEKELVICNKKVNEEQGKIIAKFNDIK